MWTISFTILIICAAPAGFICGQDDPADQNRIQGTWQLVSGASGGKAFPAEVVKNTQLLFTKNTMTTVSGTNAFQFGYKLHDKETQHAIDLDMDGKPTLFRIAKPTQRPKRRP